MGKGDVLDPALTVFVAIGDNSLRKKLYNQAFTNGNARSMISERYEQNVVWEALLAEYKSLLANYE